MAVLLVITFIMVCAALGRLDRLEAAGEDHVIEYKAVVDKLHASLGKTLDCSSTVGVVSKDAEDSSEIKCRPHGGHCYELVSVPFHLNRDLTIGMTYHEAMIDASSRCHDGERGYLAAITSEEEQDFITGLLPQSQKGSTQVYYFDVWIGGSDGQDEGTWRWVDGPDRGDQFWSGAAKDSGGLPYGRAYQNWYCYDDPGWQFCNPNNGAGGSEQDCLSMYGDGSWNDLDCNLRSQAFVVEYGSTKET